VLFTKKIQSVYSLFLLFFTCYDILKTESKYGGIRIMKRIIAMILVIVLMLSVGSTAAFAKSAGEKRAVIAADLSANQVEKIYKDFRIERGSVPEIRVTNADERKYLEGLVEDEKIGDVALSCVYIETLDEGDGLQMSIMNIKWCTEDMYLNALTTAGISDAVVKISAPHPVTGTAALTGIYKAYEDITGEDLSEEAKIAAAEELIVTGELADLIGSEEATQIVSELKKILDETQTMSDDEVREEIRKIADDYNVEISDAQIEQLLKLARSLEGLDVDQLKEKITGFANTLETAGKVSDTVTRVGEKIGSFFKSVGNFFKNLFS